MTDNERPNDAPPTGQEHLGPTEDAKISGLPDAVDIEITDDEVPAETPPQPEKPAAVEQRQPAPKRPRSDPQRRIDQLTGRLRETETNAERLVRENRELLARLETGSKETASEKEARAQAERAALVHHKRAQALERQAAERDLQAAIEAGDSAKQAEATGRLSSAAAELKSIADWEASHPAPQPGAKPAAEPTREEPRTTEPPRPAPAPLAAPAQAFIEENADWFHSNKEMREELVTYANRYEQRLAAQGRHTEINSDAYFDRLRQHMRNEFPDYDWDYADDGAETVIPAIEATTVPPSRQNAAQRPNGRMPQMTRDNAVLPANGQAAPGAKPQGNRVQVQMSDAEKELAIGQWENGVMGNHFRTGKPIANKAEAVEQWAYRKALAAKNGRAA